MKYFFVFLFLNHFIFSENVNYNLSQSLKSVNNLTIDDIVFAERNMLIILACGGRHSVVKINNYVKLLITLALITL